ncbi:basic proline-rich protein-like [Rhipicephalus sanguineus]|uniref:basic proline-rich protein-like n=1 Tax=Rhipicephalus sanguineus TaxID=34632 RepID=UPI0020C2DF6A|nr:basic proline-rich protein-like [Rhipicephalus sanguineus]
MRQAPRYNILFFLGLLFLLSTLDQGPTYVLAANDKHVKDPLYKHPGGLGRQQRPRHPPLPPIPEEGDGPARRDGWDQIMQNTNVAGIGGPPLTRFFYHPRNPHAQGPAPHVPPPRRPLPPLPPALGPRRPVLPRLPPQPPGPPPLGPPAHGLPRLPPPPPGPPPAGPPPRAPARNRQLGVEAGNAMRKPQIIQALLALEADDSELLECWEIVKERQDDNCAANDSESKRRQQRALQISAKYPSGQWLLTLVHRDNDAPAEKLLRSRYDPPP